MFLSTWVTENDYQVSTLEQFCGALTHSSLARKEAWCDFRSSQVSPTRLYFSTSPVVRNQCRHQTASPSITGSYYLLSTIPPVDMASSFTTPVARGRRQPPPPRQQITVPTLPDPTNILHGYRNTKVGFACVLCCKILNPSRAPIRHHCKARSDRGEKLSAEQVKSIRQMPQEP